MAAQGLAEDQLHDRLVTARQLGERLGRYRIGQPRGSSGMGIVYEAHDELSDRRVALKVIHPGCAMNFADARRQLAHEAYAASLVAHPHIVPIYDIGEIDGEAYIAMELVDGDNLSRWLKRHADRSADDILVIYAQAGRALAHAHAHGLAHGDFKPDNVLVDGSGDVRVIDFGLARRFGDDTADARTDSVREVVTPRTIWGTPRYMAPEQWMGLSPDARTDQFSFCVSLWESLRRAHPFGYGHEQRQRAQPPSSWVIIEPSTANPLPPGLRHALTRGLTADPLGRFPSMTALLEVIFPSSAPAAQRSLWRWGKTLLGWA